MSRQITHSTEQAIRAALEAMAAEGVLPMRPTELCRELAARTGRGFSSVWSRDHLWRPHADRSTSLDRRLEVIDGGQKVPVSLYLPAAVVKQFKELALTQQMSYQTLIAHALRRYLAAGSLSKVD
jgi:uncharacterized protein (DUF4415 family)